MITKIIIISNNSIIKLFAAQDCAGGQYLDTETNTCLICPENTYSAGGFSTLVCTSCPEGSAAPSGLARSESDCQLGEILIRSIQCDSWH